MSNWLAADVTYLGKGTYRLKNNSFRANVTTRIVNKDVADYLAGFPFFSVNHVFESVKVETEAPKPKAKKVKAKKG